MIRSGRALFTVDGKEFPGGKAHPGESLAVLANFSGHPVTMRFGLRPA